MTRFKFEVDVETDSEEHAEQVMRERIDHEEDLGFNYEVRWGHRTKSGRLLTEADFEKLADEAERGYDVRKETR